ncbi:MAG: hypothetical protein P8I93_01765 [Crocinitomicaceae bacterium]|nr:hypothetical protein [Crocinitomicaceae bacterium]
MKKSTLIRDKTLPAIPFGNLRLMKKTQSIIEKLSTSKIITCLFLLTILISCIMHFMINPQLVKYAGEMKILDIMIMGYDINYVNAFFKALGEKGRDIYLYQQLAIDMIYPLAYGGFICFSLAWILKKKNKNLTSIGLAICILPLIGVFLDFIENISNAILLLKYPKISSFQVAFSCIMTYLKYFFLIVSVLILFVLYGMFIVNKIKITNARN